MNTDAIAAAYARKIKRAAEENPESPSYTILDVPERIREAVEAKL